MSRRGVVNVLLDGQAPPAGERERFVEVPKGNDRMWAVEIRNRGRIMRGTATVWRLRALYEAVKKRHRGATLSPRGKEPIVVRSRRAGPSVCVIEPLPGPVRRLTN